MAIATRAEYLLHHREDPRLPSRPDQIYAADWQNWFTFLGNEPKQRYATLAEAQQATQALAIATKSEYLLRHREDPRLPSNPNKTYTADWQNWFAFLGNEPEQRYATLAEAQHATQALAIATSSEYKQRYREDPRLPSSPNQTYAADWQNWPAFLGNEPKQFYATLAEAQQATQALAIATSFEYKQRHREDPRLPSRPDQIYAADWQNWPAFLGNKPKRFYATLAEAQQATQALAIATRAEYLLRRREDPRLPSRPDQIYAADWPTFLGNEPKQLYATLAEAQQATQALAIATSSEYKQRHREDPRLPSRPDETYAADWQNWFAFLGNEPKQLYATLAEAQQATQALAIATRAEYLLRRHEDPRLPCSPNQFYAADWQNWFAFLGNEPKQFYATLAEAQQARQALGIATKSEYLLRRHEDPRLPSRPDETYAADWQNWPAFLGNEPKQLYATLAEAQQATQALAIATRAEYLLRRREDPRLPSNPNKTYTADWQNWPTFLGNEPKQFYATLAEAQQAAQALGIATSSEYLQRYREDSRLPSTPHLTYSTEWQSYTQFLMPIQIDTLSELKRACKVLAIKDSMQYRQCRKIYPQLPSKPDKKFKEWVDWFDLLDIPRPYPYEKLRSIVLEQKCRTLADYKKMRVTLNDPHIASSPMECYRGKGWTNTFDFFGTTRPYQVKYFEPKWKEWANLITEFLKSARGGDTKAKDLCEFVREYIEPNNFETSPLEYLTRGKTNIQPMLELFEKAPITRKKKWLFSINEYLDWIIANFLTIEDEDTGEIYRIKGAKNPFSHVNFDGEQIPVSINETNKLALPYQFVKDAREWILPPNSMLNQTSYSELHHLHKFSAEWVPIDDSFPVAPSDPDCVTKVEGGKTFLWLPIYWTYTYALMQLPARGRQIVYCDSGEADTEVPDIQNGKVVWKENLSQLAGLTTRQSMVSKAKDNDFGVYYTSNKTNFNGEGYAIPFMPLELAYWLIKLRKWQEKYNPIIAPTKWLDCTRTNLNEIQRKQKGINCFLFRDFQENEPGTFGGRLATRLAAALFFSSGEQLNSANYNGQCHRECYKQLQQLQSIPISRFKSQYTPHSMRVSLINAYAYEFGMPLEVIMKLVGHSSIIMSIYYIKSGKTGANVRERLEVGEKQALSKSTDTLKSFIEAQRIEQCKSQLIANSQEFLQTIDNVRPASSYLFKDFGMCPVGGAFCSEGGSPVAMKANIYHPVNAGYLGEQNCIQCRFFVTGPAFMMGLAALFNEISLAVHTQSHRYAKLEGELSQTITQIDVISHEIYQQKAQNEQLDKLEKEKGQLQAERRKLNSEIETRAKKMDLYMSDMNAIHKHLISCKKLINQEETINNSKLHLIVPHEFEVNIELDDVSGFQQLSEVCENAELYHSCSDELAVTRRSQALDKVLIQNGLNPQFVFLSEEQQLAVGNQMTQLMLTRLQSWEKIDKLINGSLGLNDFTEADGLSTRDIKELFAKSTPLKLVN
ncbi:VPA1269 family protein [Shewanella marisflavi]|uniref:gamma-mobile-trio integrase GmtZ n=1 Tax=Shewanella marisflavi TaxID=260364 RepID=UPI003AABC605